ncbi:hypothetical protein RS130_04405 [Paraglaciecola aquimarina]|uniref:Uncharacterized protein n=1 Tax=Paraglaciecola aquimarina TaxID=1235557 RepID=A0ABU3STE2_9ALTE|nr:hypothetical protein [Paraglaciecola aquimarina]MDU0353271.1 hypothetical protein [Paraglaciecola aquimarina]
MTVNDQEIATKGTNISISGTGGSHVAETTVNTAFETVDLGTIDGPNGPLVLGEVKAAQKGILGVGVGTAIDPNMRTLTNTGARDTKSQVFAFGGSWTGDNIKISSELSYADSTSKTLI